MATGGDPDNADESWVKKIKQADVLVSFCDDDEFQVRKYILPELDRQGIRYVNPSDHFRPGNRIPSEIAEAISICRKTLLILSHKALEGKQFTLQVLLALEKSQRTNCLSLTILLLDGLNVADIPKCPVLLNASRARLVSNIHEQCLRRVAENIRDNVELGTILPAGNFAHGMAWSHFAGYLHIILPGIEQLIQESSFYKENPGKMSTKFFMFLPMSAQGRKKLDQADHSIQAMGNLKIEGDVGGGRRVYTPTVYCVTDDEDGEQYFFVGEFPSAFCALGMIGEQILCKMTVQQIHMEVQRFYYKMDEILNHDNNKECRDRARMLMYSDEAKGAEGQPSHHVVKAIKDEINSKMTPVHLLPPQMKPIKEERKFRTDVCLMYDQKDENYGFHIREGLESKNISCSKAVLPNEHLTVIEERIQDARWTLLFVSEQSIQSSEWTHVWLSELLTYSIEQDEMKVLPLLIGVSPDNIPDYLQWITYIDIKAEKEYMSRIIQIVQGRSITMESQIPVGNVYYGLAFTFYINYLQHVLPDLKQRVQKKGRELGINDRPDTVVCSTLLEIVPKSCKSPNSITEMDPKISYAGRIDPIHKDIAGTVGRVFSCTMYKFVDETGGRIKEYYFPAEFVSPIRTLYFMHRSLIAGLNNKLMVEQAVLLIEQIQMILDADKARKKEYVGNCTIIPFDDTQNDTKLWEVIKAVIDKETSEDVNRLMSWMGSGQNLGY